MKYYKIILFSKNKKSLKKATKLFSKYININGIKKYSKKNSKRKILTILKSPHVNKIAQEQFESFTFFNQMIIFTSTYFKYLFILKKIQDYLLSDINFKISFFIYKTFNKKISSLNYDHFNLHNTSKLKKNKKLNFFSTWKNRKIKYFLMVWDAFGQLTIK